MQIKYPMELEDIFFPVTKQITNASYVISSLLNKINGRLYNNQN
jgi:hypothetical protein